MRSVFLILFLALCSIIAAYPKALSQWSDEEIKQLLDDYNVKYPEAISRKDLNKVVSSNWDNIIEPYTNWSDEQLKSHLKKRKIEHRFEGTKEDIHRNLVKAVKDTWGETVDQANTAYDNISSWIFDTWSSADLRKFAEKNNIQVKAEASRQELVDVAKQYYDAIAEKSEEKSSRYPGHWLFQHWSDSSLKEWLDERGIPVPQGTKRNQLIASIRKNSRYAYLTGQHARFNLLKNLNFANQNFLDKSGQIRDEVFDRWSDSDLKEWADYHGVSVPQNSNRDKIIAHLRRNKHLLLGDIQFYASEASKYAIPFLSKATQAVLNAAENLQDSTFNLWSDLRLHEYLDARKVTVPLEATREQIVALAAKSKNLPVSDIGSWTFGSFSTEDLKKWLTEQGQNVEGSRAELVEAASKYYEEAKSDASEKGASIYNSLASSLSSAWDNSKVNAFETWSESDLKAYLDSYGIPTYQGSTRNQLLSEARRNFGFFTHGADPKKFEKLHQKLLAHVHGVYGTISHFSLSLYHHIYQHFYQHFSSIFSKFSKSNDL